MQRILLALAVAALPLSACQKSDQHVAADKTAPPAASGSNVSSVKPSLTVTAITPQMREWPQVLSVSGNVAAWQEAVISTEINNLRITDVLVNVGDKVNKGQVLARISNDAAQADLEESKATVAEAEATLAEAKSNGERARQLQSTGFISNQQLNQYLTAEKTGLARLNAARARLQTNQLHLAQTTVRAPDGGIISARTATVGSMAQSGQELFRLIRGGRLEWRAEVSSADLGKLKPGVSAILTTPSGAQVQGKVRSVAPTVDPKTLNGLVYVDLPVAQTGDGLRAGAFARGEFELARTKVMALPQSALLLRDGFAYVFKLEGDAQPNQPGLATSKVSQAKVGMGRRVNDLIEITGGLTPDARVVASGAGFLADGDVVRVVAR